MTSTLSADVSLDDIRNAAAAIRPHIHRTPVATSKTIDALASRGLVGRSLNIITKCENLQKVGAFKIRGATNAILNYLGTHDIKPSDLTVVTHSSGNHAQALALAARELGVSCYVVMPSNSPAVKKAAVKGYGASVTECVPTLQAREEGIQSIIDMLTAEGKAVEFVPPYNDVRIIAGQGTAALELLEQSEELGKPLDVLITPVGGGGLLSGCAIAAKGISSDTWVIGAEPVNANDAHRSFTSKNFVPSVNPQTIADGLKTSLGDITFPLILKHVDAIHTVTESEITSAMKLVYERMKLVIEPSAAVGLAVVLYSDIFRRSIHELAAKRGKNCLNVGIVFSGGNVDLSSLATLFESAGDN